jgi:hypothetical protein
MSALILLWRELVAVPAGEEPTGLPH